MPFYNYFKFQPCDHTPPESKHFGLLLLLIHISFHLNFYSIGCKGAIANDEINFVQSTFYSKFFSSFVIHYYVICFFLKMFIIVFVLFFLVSFSFPSFSLMLTCSLLFVVFLTHHYQLILLMIKKNSALYSPYYTIFTLSLILT